MNRGSPGARGRRGGIRRSCRESEGTGMDKEQAHGYTVPGCPCRGCEARREGCHSVCLQYKEWAEKQAEARQARQLDRVMVGYAEQACERVRKGTHKAFVRRRK